MNIDRGFTLIEVLIALAVIGILSAIAIPGYFSYLQSARDNVAVTNMQTLMLAEDAYFFEHDTYVTGNYSHGASDFGLATSLDWSPDMDGAEFDYAVTECPDKPITACYLVAVTGFDGKVNKGDRRDR